MNYTRSCLLAYASFYLLMPLIANVWTHLLQKLQILTLQSAVQLCHKQMGPQCSLPESKKSYDETDI